MFCLSFSLTIHVKEHPFISASASGNGTPRQRKRSSIRSIKMRNHQFARRQKWTGLMEALPTQCFLLFIIIAHALVVLLQILITLHILGGGGDEGGRGGEEGYGSDEEGGRIGGGGEEGSGNGVEGDDTNDDVVDYFTTTTTMTTTIGTSSSPSPTTSKSENVFQALLLTGRAGTIKLNLLTSVCPPARRLGYITTKIYHLPYRTIL